MSKGKDKKKLYIHVPTHIVRNADGFYINNKEFLLYARLCFLYFRNQQEKEITVDHKSLMQNLKISDTRTFKSRMLKLFNLGLIENKVDKLPTKGLMTIIFNSEVGKGQHFTKLSAEIFTYFRNDQLDENAIRQVFYYKSHINMNDKKKDRTFCYVGFDTLVERLRISKETIAAANKTLTDCKLIKTIKHQLGTDYEYNDADELQFTRWNNHYYVANTLH